jgi:hypothetical protein
MPNLKPSAWSGAHISAADLFGMGGNGVADPEAQYALYNQKTAIAYGLCFDDANTNFYTAAHGAYFVGPITNNGNGTCSDYYGKPVGCDEPCKGNTGATGHFVTIVGWDDNYPATNFVEPPVDVKGHHLNGAWIVKNSWGTDWGDPAKPGYFHISYYDTSNTMYYAGWVYHGVQPASTYNWTYQYDTFGWTDLGGNFGYGSGYNAAWVANVFRANSQGAHIKAVGFYVVDPGTHVRTYVCDNVYYDPALGITDPSNGTCYYGPNSVTQFPNGLPAGYQTLTFKTPVKVSPGKNFSVILWVNDVSGGAGGFIIPIEYDLSGDTSRNDAASFTPGQSFFTWDTQGTGAWHTFGTWTDFYSYFTGPPPSSAHVCLKAFGG